jgi:hypothetical protein
LESRPARTRLWAVVAVLALLGASLFVYVEHRRLTETRARLAEVERRLDDRGDGGAPPSPGDASEPGDLLGMLEDLLGESSGLLGGGSSCLSVLAESLSGGFPDASARAGSSPAPVAQQVPRIARADEEIRGLDFDTVPEPTFLTSQELAARVAEQVREEYPDGQSAVDSATLVALGALPPGSDLKQLLVRGLSEQVAGFYDPDTDELVVGSGSAGSLDPAGRVIMSHELEHALVDQTLGLPVAAIEGQPGREDEGLAAQALVEGDATLVMQLYTLRQVSLTEQVSLLAESAVSEAALADLPPHVGKSLLFPYLSGLSFVCSLHADGGWPAVNEAYGDPPTSSAQILFPERYEAGEDAVDPRDPEEPGTSWRLLGRRQQGAAELLWMFEAPGGQAASVLDDALTKAAGWAGGEVHVWGRRSDRAVGLALVQRSGEESLCQSLTEWHGAAFPDADAVDTGPGEVVAATGEGHVVVLACGGSEVRLGIGPDIATARSLAA